MPQNTMDTNKVVVAGKIIEGCKLNHELYGEKFYEFQIQTPRLSEIADVLPIMVSERLVTQDKLAIGSFVVVEGQFRSYNNRNESNLINNKLKLIVFARDVQVVGNEEETKNQNLVFLNGFICKAPVYRTTLLGREICDIIIAVNRAYHKSDYIPIITWGRNARFSQNLKIGDNIKIWGRVQSRDYEKKLDDGNVLGKTAYEVSVSKIELVKK